MVEIAIEIEFTDDDEIILWNRTHHFPSLWWKEKKEYIEVRGKTMTYRVKGLDNYEQAKSFAIWHYARQQQNGDMWYRLD